MKLIISFDRRRQEATITPVDIDNYDWNFIIRALSDYSFDFTQVKDKLFIPWRLFLSFRGDIARFAKAHSIDIELSDDVKDELKTANLLSYSVAKKSSPITRDQLLGTLMEKGFSRPLTNNQIENLCKLCPLPSGATFSVPGAGKTTEALGFFYYNASPQDRLLVIAPKNAFGAWEEQLSICVPSEKEQFVRLRGGENAIADKLKNNPRFMLITYQQYPRVKDLITRYLQQNSCFVFLDESHRIKGGRSGVSSDAILDISHLPTRKLIMSGTPMPQSEKDLIPQISFLYPELRINGDNVRGFLDGIYVRTTKGQLGIPPVEHRLIQLEMDDLQKQVYETLRSEMKRQLIPMISDASRFSLREIGKRVVKVLQFVSNPALLARDIEFAFDRSLGDLLAHDCGRKIDYVCYEARKLASENKKVIIWSQFVENVELLAARLSDIGADYIHGGVETGDEDENDTREWKIKEFHDNPSKMVLVANPAAASEGISLHKVCQHAIYLDRSFNAAHYLQSEDRIHRLGLSSDQKPIVEIVEYYNSIDQVVRTRLQNKVDQMSMVLNDTSLKVDAIPYDFDYSESEQLSPEDVRAVLGYFFGSVETK